jgi:putative redox protein
MSIELRRIPSQPMASTVAVRAHEFTTDVGSATGGADAGPDPHDLYDAALGACKSLTLMWYAKRKGYNVRDVRVHVMRDATQERAGVYKIDAQIEVEGDLTEAQVHELQSAAEKCPVHKLMTQVTTEVHTHVSLLKA